MKTALRWAARAIAGLAGLLLLASAAVYGASEYRFQRTYDDLPAASLLLAGDASTLARGRHLAVIRGCVDCHGADLGGKVFLDVPPVAVLHASNLTAGRGGVGATYSDADWDRAIRHGVGPDRKPLLVMPSNEFHVLSDADVAALIAYLKSLPPVDREPGENRVGPVGRVLFLAGQLPAVPAELIDHGAPRAAAPAPGATAEYGAYLATGCQGCHGPGFTGGRIPGTPPEFPPATNITPDAETGIGEWSEADFFRALREGKRPDGTALRTEMPWQLTREMTDDEIRALWLHLRSVPAARR